MFEVMYPYLSINMITKTTYYKNAANELHNMFDAAVIYKDGSKEYWINGKFIGLTEEEFERGKKLIAFI